MAITVGSVAVDIVPSAQRFATQLRAQVVPQADRIGNDIGKVLADQIAKGIKDGLGGGFAGSREAGAQAGRSSGDSFAGEFDRQVQTKIRAALRSLPPLEIGVAASEAEQKIRDLKQSLLDLSGKRIGVDIDAEEARREIDRLFIELNELGRRSPNIQVRMDAGRAAAELAALQAEIDKVATDSPTVRVDVDAGGRRGCRCCGCRTGGGGCCCRLVREQPRLPGHCWYRARSGHRPRGRGCGWCCGCDRCVGGCGGRRSGCGGACPEAGVHCGGGAEHGCRSVGEERGLGAVRSGSGCYG
ncbi:MAG: hypothetical protein ACXVGC_00105 [Mycobacteriaceae bacterium]